jgi:2-oxo-3-hexenedioate decarboxylase
VRCCFDPVRDRADHDPLAEPRAAQIEALRRRVAAGERLAGYKTALLGRVAQRRLGASGPVWGWLTDAMELADGAVFECASQLRTKAEAEIVFVLGSDLVGPGVTEEDVARATAAIRPGIELPGSQRATAAETVAAFVADNTSAGRFVLGRCVFDFPLRDLPRVEAVMRRDGEVVSSGAGARVLGNPARAVALLANSLAEAGRELHAGMLVFTGAVADPVAVTSGHSYSAQFRALGTVGFTAV